MTPTPFQKAYTAAVALNNIGITLLQRRLYEEATDVFNDAVSVMKELSAHFQATSSDNVLQDPPYPSDELDSMLRRANIGLAKSSKHTTESLKIVIVSEEDSANIVSLLLQEGACFQLDRTFAVRLEMKSFSIRDCENRNPDLESAVVLINFGAAQACLAAASSCEVHSGHRLQGSFMLYNLAYTLLQDKCEPDTYHVTEDFLSCYLPLSILVLKSLVRLSTILGLVEDARSFYAQSMELQTCFLEMESVLGNTFRETNEKLGAPAA